MKILEVITPRMMNRAGAPLLRTTPRQLQQARDQKTQMIALIPPLDFLKLTTMAADNYDFRDQAQPIRNYNSYAKSGSSSVLPFIMVDLAKNGSGRVRAHEGRHRAGAILNAGGEWMRIGIQLRSYEGYESEFARADLARHGHHTSNIEYQLSQADLPEWIRSQYDPHMVSTASWRIEQGDYLAKYRRGSGVNESYLMELFNNPVPVVAKSDNEFEYMVGDKPFGVYFVPSGDYAFEVILKRLDVELNPYASQGDIGQGSFAVYSTMVSLMDQFLKRRKPDEINFYGFDPHQDKLYHKFAEWLVKNNPDYKVTFGDMIRIIRREPVA